MKRAKGLPPLPASVFHPLGAIPVLIVADLRDEDGKEIFGYWDAYKREIQIRAGMHLTAAWTTLWHERTHADICEIGVVVSTDQEEAICNAVALSRVTEMLASL